MDSFELNKILGAILGTCLILLAVNISAGAIFAPVNPAKPGYDIPVPKEAAKGEAQPATKEEPIEVRLASASTDKGQNSAKVCLACHTFEKNGPNKVGPNLWGVIGRARGSHPGFAYSAAMKAKGGEWTVEDLDKFLTDPKGFVPGTAMGFAGFARGNQRADVIAYLNTLSDDPKPLPKAAEGGSAPQPKAAEGGAPAPTGGGQPSPAQPAQPAPPK
jgi:cytochrome c